MHYYSFNIGDYTSHTAHLSPVEDIAYRRLLDLYYQTELPIPNDIKAVCRLIRMRDHADDVQQVLFEFFTLTDEGWTSARCSREIEDYHAKADKARANGKLGGRPKKQSESENNQAGFSSLSLANPGQTQAKANQEPRTNNQEPSLNKDSADKPQAPAKASRKSSQIEKPESVEQQVWDDFLTMRKAKGAPVTATALSRLEAEAVKARMSVQQAMETCCAQGWRGFKAEWVAGQSFVKQAPAIRPKSFAQQEREAGWLRWEEMTGRKHPELEKIRAAESGFAGDVIDITPRGDGLLLEG